MNLSPMLDLGLGMMSSWSQGKTAQAQAKAANDIRKSRNEVSAGKTKLAALMQSLNNNRILANAGRTRDALQRNVSRTVQSQTAMGFEKSIAAAEQMGAAAVALAASGQGGSAINAASSVAAMSIARQREYQKSQDQAQTYEQLQQLSGVMPSAVQSLGGTYYMPDQDFAHNIVPNMSDFLIQGLAGKQSSLNLFMGEMMGKTGNPNMGPPWLSPGMQSAPAQIAMPGATSFPVQSQTRLSPNTLVPITL